MKGGRWGVTLDYCGEALRAGDLVRPMEVTGQYRRHLVALGIWVEAGVKTGILASLRTPTAAKTVKRSSQIERVGDPQQPPKTTRGRAISATSSGSRYSGQTPGQKSAMVKKRPVMDKVVRDAMNRVLATESALAGRKAVKDFDANDWSLGEVVTLYYRAGQITKDSLDSVNARGTLFSLVDNAKKAATQQVQALHSQDALAQYQGTVSASEYYEQKGVERKGKVAVEASAAVSAAAASRGARKRQERQKKKGDVGCPNQEVQKEMGHCRIETPEPASDCEDASGNCERLGREWSRVESGWEVPRFHRNVMARRDPDSSHTWLDGMESALAVLGSVQVDQPATRSIVRCLVSDLRPAREEEDLARLHASLCYLTGLVGERLRRVAADEPDDYDRDLPDMGDLLLD